MTIGQRLKRLRESADLTLEYVGSKVGVKKQTIYKYETGEVTNIPTYAIEVMASLYETTPAYIMGWETEAPSAGLSPTTPDTMKKVPGEGDELAEYLEELRTRPEMRMYFSLAKNATKEDVEDAVRIVEAFLKGREGRDNE